MLLVTHNVTLTRDLARFVVNLVRVSVYVYISQLILMQSGNGKVQGRDLIDVWSTIDAEQSKPNTDNNGPDENASDVYNKKEELSGKLMTSEEIHEGHVSLKAGNCYRSC